MEEQDSKVRIGVDTLTGVMRRTGKRERIHSDVLGSYTGMGMRDDDPVQDADDL